MDRLNLHPPIGLRAPFYFPKVNDQRVLRHLCSLSLCLQVCSMAYSLRNIESMSVLRELYRHTSGLVRAYGQLSPTSVVSRGVQQECSLYPFLLKSIIEDLQNAFSGLVDIGVELLPENRVFDLGYADNMALLSDNVQAVRRRLDRLAVKISLKMQGTCLRLTEVDTFIHLL